MTHSNNLRIARTIGIGVAILGLTVLIFGWGCDIALFKSVLPGLVSMKANTALGFILCGISLALIGQRRAYIIRLCASGSALLLGLVSLCEYIFDWNAGIDQWLFNDPESAFTFYPGRISIFTATSFVLVAGSLLLHLSKKLRVLIRIMALATGLFALLPIGGYLFGNLAFPYFDKSSAMALHTALGFAFLASGILIATLTVQQYRLMTFSIRAGIFALLISSIAAFYNFKQSELSVRKVEHSYQTLMMLESVAAGAYKYQKDIRSFLLTGDENAVTDANDTRTELLRYFNALHQQLTDEPIQLQRLAILLQMLEQRFAAVEVLLQKRRQNGIAAATKWFDQGRFQHYSKMFSDQLTLIKIDETQELAEYKRVNQLKDAISKITLGFILIINTLIILAYIKRLYCEVDRRKQNEAKLRFAANVFSHAREGITITDAMGTILDVNDSFCRITGYSREEAIGQNPRILQSGRQPKEFYSAMWRGLLEKGYWHGEIWNRRKNGEINAEMLTISTVRDEKGDAQNYVALFTDITAIKEHQSKLEHIAHYDVLTDLPNRVLLADRLAQSMSQCQRRQQSLAVVFLDLDGFKAVNDHYGHDAGDELLIVIAQRLKENLREGDTLARLGGDEFVAVLVDLEKAEECEPILERLLQAAADPVIIADAVLHVSASIGATIFPQDRSDVDQLMRHADQAMYVAKQAGKNRYHFFDVQLDARAKAHLVALARIEKALNQHEFRLYIQPKLNLHTGGIAGAEALIRWMHPVRGLVPPNEFLPIIQDQDLARDVGEWVIREGMQLLDEWRKLGLDIPLSVNVGARQLRDKNFAKRLADILASYPEVPPQQLEFEIVESAALDDIYKISALIADCRSLGVKFSLDDFGTGYSSLTYLKRLSVNTLKIDQSFIRDMLEDHNDLAIVRGVIGLAQAFNSHTVAEGVETWQHAARLKALGCEIAQGYVIAKPMPAEEIPVWLTNFKMPEL